jgi:glycosyltransferase involved in cell wall biosynthesis
MDLSRERLTMLPVGVDCSRLVTALERDELRLRFNVPRDAFVILSVTTLNRKHKRVDYLIEEVAGLDGNFLLWIDGSLHPDGDPTLLKLAADLLGNRHRHTHMESDRVVELFKIADLMVSTSLQESFGMAIVESLCSGLPVLTHDSPHFRWLVGDAAHMVDMSRTGNLTSCLARLIREPSQLKRPEPERVCARFGWPTLKESYLEMYRKVLRV